MMFIETIEQYLEQRSQIEPVVIIGKLKLRVALPCANTLVVARGLVQANTYNPNSVPDDKMELLRQSIVDNGFAFPIVTIYDPDLQKFVVIDGFHRFLISGPDWLDMSHVPIVVLEHDISKRMAATWQFNKARGVHQVDMDADLIRALIEQGVPEDEIAQRLGIDLDTIFRYKQMTGIAELFKGSQYSMSWEITEVSDDEMAVR
jgi:ParB-like chromosome segregation protein Spo0J